MKNQTGFGTEKVMEKKCDTFYVKWECIDNSFNRNSMYNKIS